MIDIEYIIPFKSSSLTPERDANLSKCISCIHPSRYFVSTLNGPFNRSKYLNYGITSSKSEYIFCLDADIIIPKHFDSLVQDVLNYYDIFFPICLNEIKSKTFKDVTYEWRHSGLGMVGCKREVWNKFELKWNESRTTWGGEDNDLYNECVRKGMNIARFWCIGLIHQWHPESLEYKNKHVLIT